VTDRPIIFSAPMVRALLAGTKTQTRRLIRPPPSPNAPHDGGTVWVAKDGLHVPHGTVGHLTVAEKTGLRLRYAVGDRLWVREAWTARMTHGWSISDARSRMFQEEILYRADGDASIDGWWPSIHMPREFSRLTLTVTDVRVQRLLDISEEDAKAEGFTDGRLDDGFGPRDIGDGWVIESAGTWASAAGHFQILWQELHPEWDGYDNPWIVALTFTVDRRNIDA
jgi:hypothetical protein